MNAVIQLAALSALFVICDLPWLYGIGGWAQRHFKTVQGGAPMEFRWAGAPPVYIALAFLLSRTRNLTEAVLTGWAVYAVYDFTNYATLKKYELNFALADTAWGGVLFGIVRTVAEWLKVV
jgi:uncharacterized membrane protein